jgi:hypothetical protein
LGLGWVLIWYLFFFEFLGLVFGFLGFWVIGFLGFWVFGFFVIFGLGSDLGLDLDRDPDTNPKPKFFGCKTSATRQEI